MFYLFTKTLEIRQQTYIIPIWVFIQNPLNKYTYYRLESDIQFSMIFTIRQNNMSLFKKISGMLSSSSNAGDDHNLWVSVKCGRCGEIIRARIDLRNDLSIDYGDNGGKTNYICRKTLIGEGRCFQRVEVKLTFDKNRQLIDRGISGGDFVNEPE